MREIKFRAYDTKNKEMVNDIWIAPEYGWSVMADNDAMSERTKSERNQWIITQYTGLHDRNWKEIYEGDIVNRHLGHPPRVITWTPEGRYLGWYSSRLEGQQTQNIIDHLPLGKDEKIEVIGNIYENPDLLK